MATPSAPAPTAPGSPRSKLAVLRAFFLASVAGYLLTVGATAKILVIALAAVGVPTTGVLQVVSSLGGLALATGAGIILYKLAQVARRRLLWRVRRKLIVSYLLIGFVPALLIVVFFVVCGWLLFTNVSSYMVRSGLADLGNKAASLASNVAVELEGAPSSEAAAAMLAARQVETQRALPGASVAVVRVDPKRCGGRNAVRSTLFEVERPTAITVGEWEHAEPPEQLPSWVTCEGFSSALAYDIRDEPYVFPSELQIVIRAVAMSKRSTGYAVVVDLPLTETVKKRLEESTGIAVGPANFEDKFSRPLKGRPQTALSRPAVETAARPGGRAPILSVGPLDVHDWLSGKAQTVVLQLGMSVSDIYHRLSVTEGSSEKDSLGDRFVLVLKVVMAMLLIVVSGAAVTAMALARSITGSVHELFAGTERVRQGDFGHRIAVLAKDQLGELADSFNLMIGSLEDSVRQVAEKRRLDEEMRLARESQMALLPRGPLEIPGMRVAAVCVPAREVGGDYYDVLPLPDGRVGMLIADVSGKGMSAALYMAELKGLILSLSQIHQSPRDLLIAANRLISEHLDSRSFITMTYAVIDPAARTMTYARAGHTPLMYLPKHSSTGGRAEMLIPDGMVLGLRLDGGARFPSLLEEATLSLESGDMLAFFTDGISEAMNDQAECFGEPRLGQLIEEHAHLPVEELRERILREIEAFVGGAPQHDDMTLILLEVNGDAPIEPAHD